MPQPKPPFLLFDLGGTNTRLAISWDGHSIAKHLVFKTPPDFDQGLAEITKFSQELLPSPPGAVVGGVAGPLDPQKSLTTNPPNLPGYKNMPLKQKLQEHFQAEVFLENDTALVGLGEAIYGAGKDFHLVTYLTVSTGVNGVKISSGKIEDNAYGFEIGHQIVDLDSSVFPQSRGELEDFISGREIQKRHHTEPALITDPKIWQDITRYLSFGIHNTIVYWSPEIVVLGGSIIKKISLEQITENLESIMTIFPSLPQIQKASLGDLGGLYGALHYLNFLFSP